MISPTEARRRLSFVATSATRAAAILPTTVSAESATVLDRLARDLELLALDMRALADDAKTTPPAVIGGANQARHG